MNMKIDDVRELFFDALAVDYGNNAAELAALRDDIARDVHVYEAYGYPMIVHRNEFMGSLWFEFMRDRIECRNESGALCGVLMRPGINASFIRECWINAL